MADRICQRCGGDGIVREDATMIVVCGACRGRGVTGALVGAFVRGWVAGVVALCEALGWAEDVGRKRGG